MYMHEWMRPLSKKCAKPNSSLLWHKLTVLIILFITVAVLCDSLHFNFWKWESTFSSCVTKWLRTMEMQHLSPIKCFVFQSGKAVVPVWLVTHVFWSVPQPALISTLPPLEGCNKQVSHKRFTAIIPGKWEDTRISNLFLFGTLNRIVHGV